MHLSLHEKKAWLVTIIITIVIINAEDAPPNHEAILSPKVTQDSM